MSLAPYQIEKRSVVILAGLILLLGGFLLAVPDWRLALQEVRRPQVWDYARWGLWWAAAVNLGFAVSLIMTVKLWASQEASTTELSPVTTARFFWILAFVMVAAAAVRMPRLMSSLSHEEANHYRRYITSPVSETNAPLPWIHTLWAQQGQFQNPGLASATSRLSFAIFGPSAKDGHLAGNEWTLRLPAFVMGLSSIVILAWLGRRLVGIRTGLAAAFLAAIHPWHVRYSTEFGPGAWVLLASSLMIFGLIQSVRTGLWRWWLLYALAMAALISSFPAALYYALGLTLAAFIGRWRQDGQRWRRLVVSSILGLGLSLPWILPAIPQWMKVAKAAFVAEQSVPHSFWADLPSLLVMGLPAWDVGFGDESHLSMEFLWNGFPWLVWLGTFFGAVTAYYGLQRVRAFGGGSLLPLGAAFGLGGALFIYSGSGKALPVSHLLFLLPSVLVMMAAGLAGMSLRTLGKDLADQWSARFSLATAAVGCLLLGGSLSQILVFPKENLRPAVEMMTRLEPQALKAVVNRCSEGQLYDPTITVLNTEEELQALTEQARKENRPLYASFAHEKMGRETAEPLIEAISQSEDFELIASTDSSDDPQDQHHVYRWVGK